MMYSALMSVYAGEVAVHLSQSIDSMLAQTVPPHDFVLVCDGFLTAELDEVIQRYASLPCFRILRLPKNKGLAASLDAGMALCQTDIIARMDSDDISNPTRCEEQLAYMNSADIVGAWVEEFTSTPGDLGLLRKTAVPDGAIRRFAKRRNPFNHPTVVFRKHKAIEAGGYENRFPLAEDYHLWVKMLMAGCRACNVPKVLVHMRTGQGLYHRRGGLAYLKTLLRFRAWLYQTGFSDKRDYLLCTLAHTISCLSPKWIRKALYIRLLRK